MGYRLEFKQSPNYTPAAQVRGAYGRARTIEFGAGHWWGDPNAGYSIAGVINTFLNPARQASAHAVIQEGYVVEMVRAEDVAWATNNANPYTVAIELKPNMTAGDKETCAEYIADKGWHNLTWKPHNQLGSSTTQCNPLPWGEIMARAKQIYADKHNTPAPAPTPAPAANLVWNAYSEGTRKFKLNKATKLWSFNQTSWAGFGSGVKDFAAGELIDIKGYVLNTTLNAIYLVTPYSFDNKIANGFNSKDIDLYVEPAPQPEPAPVYA